MIMEKAESRKGGREREERADSSLGSYGGDLETENTFKYPPELLGTSWGSYLFSLPPTAGRSGRRVAVSDDEQNPGPERKVRAQSHAVNDYGHPKRSILPTPALTNCATAPERAQVHGVKCQPRPLLRSLFVTLRETQRELESCGIDSSPLSEACRAVEATQEEGSLRHPSTTSCPCAETTAKTLEGVLTAVVVQARKMQEHATFLRLTAAQLEKSQQQFTREQRELQQAMNTTLSHIMAEKHDLEEKKELMKYKRGREKDQMVTPRKSRSMALKESKERLALLQAQREQTRLEKVLLQLQRELRELEQAHKATRLELTAEQYTTQKLHKRLLKTNMLVPQDFTTQSLHPRMERTQQQFTDHHQHLHRLKEETEACRLKMLEMGSQLKGHKGGRPAILSQTKRMEHASQGEGRTQYLPPIVNTKKGQHLSVITSAQAPVTKAHDQQQTHNFSRSELMSLAKFRSPEVAEHVLRWLEKGGHIHGARHS